MHPLEHCAVSNEPADLLARRAYPEPEHAYRSPFERDRARIIHSRAFRRLAGKTQVFSSGGTAGSLIAGEPSDHFRSRLTHTMEVAQIARTMATTLGLNHNLTEALALVHDIGHPPFGHAGERALDAALREHDLRFDHNLHALRIVESFEVRYAGFPGLNLTLAVREGIIKHSHDYTTAEQPQLAEYLLDEPPPLEAQIIDLADEIAYLTADLDDGMEAGLLDLAHVRAHLDLFERFYEPLAQAHAGVSEKLVFNEALKRMLNALVGDLLDETVCHVQATGARSLADIRSAGRRLVAFSPSMEADRMEAKRYLYAHLYGSAALKRDHAMAETVVRDLFRAWMADPALLPASYAARMQNAHEKPARVVADYIAGMTDHFILQQHAAWKNAR
ncbi:deoxyguanosinetriphosphate triphosphohydrolase family protein [Acidipila sp. EB88]|uniref:deoxyguanosinetriphosphate triphosphohydrolase family protein n=1 Tax=Acidipila sp. EB88 TaxID=2305226 RepID=UPI000F5E4DC0|nr:dNTP triphosphohydrolase [Acidipila sp. EB88]RRA48898.1 dNTP triphosphohydrolase [Acidipila sp. EB88]